MLFYIKAEVTMRVFGISGPFVRTVSWLVNGANIVEAKQKYEAQVKRDFAHMQFETAEFEYKELTGEIK